MPENVSSDFECVGHQTRPPSRTAERCYFKFRVRWAADSHSLTHVSGLGRVRLARLLKILN
ncbi:MAG: hypothetical protein A2007_00050 [Verrucomicrobia bacterium GWC2_42_7]|nr:MAG: hypothetical protein A2007_00050 [Verrucomicrobia bacterium GWC2_42_7]